MNDVEYTPFKCPDCKVWWRTATHKCEVVSYSPPVTTTTTVSEQSKHYPSLPTNKKTCMVCGRALLKHEFYTCKKHESKYSSNEYNKKKEHQYGYGSETSEDKRNT